MKPDWFLPNVDWYMYVSAWQTRHMVKCIKKHTKNLTPINPTCPGLHLHFAINGDQSQLHCCCFLPVEMQQTYLSATSHAKTIDYIASPHTHNPAQSMYVHVFRVPLKQPTTTRKKGSNNGGWLKSSSYRLMSPKTGHCHPTLLSVARQWMDMEDSGYTER